jgi:hypothetical protein
MGSAMTLSGSFFPPANSHGEHVDGEQSEHSYRRVFAMFARTSRTMFANVRVRLKMFAYRPVPREAINEPLPFHPDEVRAKIK